MEKIEKKLKSKIDLLPNKPGVYLMKNDNKRVIYVGKAQNLKKRVPTYFTKNSDEPKLQRLKKHISSFSYIITNTEQESLLLEDTLIKKHLPKYNILLKDDKRYPFFKITNDYFPRLIITREFNRKTGKYFGPYSDTRALKRTKEIIQTLFPIRICSLVINEGKSYKKPCLNYQIGKCPAPCIGKIGKKEYEQRIESITKFLNGKFSSVRKQIFRQMKEASVALKFERARKLKEQLDYLDSILSTQSVFFTDGYDRDVISGYIEEKICAITVLRVLEGRLTSKYVYQMKMMESFNYKEILVSFLKQYYLSKIDNLPYQIILDKKPNNFDSLYLLFKKRLVVPQKGKMGKLLLIAKKNAFNFVEEEKLKHLRKSVRTIYPIQELKEKLKLSTLPRKIVCIDISTIQGADTVASLVYFENGKPKKGNYRHFAMKNFKIQDDYAAIRQTMDRFLGKIDDYAKVDLIIIDGGKGQLSSAKEILNKYKLKYDLISLAKRIEEVFIPSSKDSIILSKNSYSLKLLTQVRNEAHRFAITYHRKKRGSRILFSKLDSLVGKKRKFILLKSFGSVKNIKKATYEDLISIAGIGDKLSKKILTEL